MTFYPRLYNTINTPGKRMLHLFYPFLRIPCPLSWPLFQPQENKALGWLTGLHSISLGPRNTDVLVIFPTPYLPEMACLSSVSCCCDRTQQQMQLKDKRFICFTIMGYSPSLHRCHSCRDLKHLVIAENIYVRAQLAFFHFYITQDPVLRKWCSPQWIYLHTYWDTPP